MSIHSSLRISGAGAGKRNVWSRMERILALKKQGRWQDGDAVEGLPKVRTSFKAKAKVRKAEPAEAAAAAAAAPAAPAQPKAPAAQKK